jgi:hypothetical protein
MADAPLSGDETGGFIKLICPTATAEYFRKRDWTGQITLKGLDKSAFWRNGIGADLKDGRVSHEVEGG